MSDVIQLNISIQHSEPLIFRTVQVKTEENIQLVKRNFPNMKIKMVQEIKEGNVLVYKIHLENDAILKHVVIADGEVIPYAQYTKSR